MKFYAETPCEHGSVSEHWKKGTAGVYEQDVCPGGSRVEVTAEAAGEALMEFFDGWCDSAPDWPDAKTCATEFAAIVETAMRRTRARRP